jgi:PAS domain-containing protein
MSKTFTRAVMEMLAPAGEAVTIATTDGYIIAANPAVERVYRRPVKEVIGKHPLIFCLDTPKWKKLSETIWTSINETGGWDGVVLNTDQDREFPILLRTRRVLHEGTAYVVSWARPFPRETPFNLSPQEAACFRFLGQGCTIGEVAAQVPRADRTGNLSESTVMTNLRRVWKKSGIQTTYSTAAMEHLAIRCHEAGWDPEMKMDRQIVSEE